MSQTLAKMNSKKMLMVKIRMSNVVKLTWPRLVFDFARIIMVFDGLTPKMVTRMILRGLIYFCPIGKV